MELTNQYRAKMGLRALSWNDEVYKQCVDHSMKMAKGRVPFGHHGFGSRIKKLRFRSMSSKENVCWNMDNGRAAAKVNYLLLTFYRKLLSNGLNLLVTERI